MMHLTLTTVSVAALHRGLLCGFVVVVAVVLAIVILIGGGSSGESRANRSDPGLDRAANAPYAVYGHADHDLVHDPFAPGHGIVHDGTPGYAAVEADTGPDSNDDDGGLDFDFGDGGDGDGDGDGD